MLCILFFSWRTLSDIKKDFTTTWDVTLKTSYPTFFKFTKEKKINILHEGKKSRSVDCLLETLIENYIDENIKNATLNHPLYDDELKNMIEENIHNIWVQQNDVKKKTWKHRNTIRCVMQT
jgi:hypothetical protein